MGDGHSVVTVIIFVCREFKMKHFFLMCFAIAICSTANAGAGACSTTDIVIKSQKAGFKKVGRRMFMDGVGVLVNRCADPVGVEVKMTAYDKNGDPVATHQRWPASVSNIPPGEYTFSLLGFLDYSPDAKSFKLSVASVNRW